MMTMTTARSRTRTQQHGGECLTMSTMSHLVPCHRVPRSSVSHKRFRGRTLEQTEKDGARKVGHRRMARPGGVGLTALLYLIVSIGFLVARQTGVAAMPGMTMTEQILAKHAKKARVAPGENVWVDVDVLMTHDVCGPGTIGVFHEQFGRDAKVWDP